MAARQIQRLTNNSIRTKKPGLHADGDGLILRVTKSGSRSWILRTIVQGRRPDIGLGIWPTVPWPSARDKSRPVAKDCPVGWRPGRRRATRATHQCHYSEKQRRSSTASSPPTGRIRSTPPSGLTPSSNTPSPTLGNSRVDAIRAEHIGRALLPIWLSKPETARRVIQLIGTVLLWAKGNGLRSGQPQGRDRGHEIGSPPRHGDRQKHHKALPYVEVPQFIAKLRTFSMSEPIKLAFEFLILTATRTNEVLGAKWPEVNLADKV